MVSVKEKDVPYVFYNEASQDGVVFPVTISFLFPSGVAR
jgi:hypothetical protein